MDGAPLGDAPLDGQPLNLVVVDLGRFDVHVLLRVLVWQRMIDQPLPLQAVKKEFGCQSRDRDAPLLGQRSEGSALLRRDREFYVVALVAPCFSLLGLGCRSCRRFGLDDFLVEDRIKCHLLLLLPLPWPSTPGPFFLFSVCPKHMRKRRRSLLEFLASGHDVYY